MKTPTVRTPLAVRLPNWVGDVVMTVPTLLQLSRCGFELHAVGKGWAKDLLAGLPVQVHPIPKGILAQRGAIRRLAVRRGLLFPNSLSSAASMRLAGVKPVGYSGDGRRLLLHRAVERPTNLHEVEYFWRLGAAVHQAWGSKDQSWPATPPTQLGLVVGDQQKIAAARALKEARVSGPYLVACPLAVGTTQGESRIWPHFSELCTQLIGTGHQLVACPGPGEEEACASSLPGATLLPGLSLGTYAAVMQSAQRVVANNSGPMHLAAAVGTPVLGIFGVGDVARTRPWGGQYVGGSGRWPTLDEVIHAFDGLKLNVSRAAS